MFLLFIFSSEYKRHLDMQNPAIQHSLKELASYIEKHAKWPNIEKIKKKGELYLVKNKQNDAAVINWFNAYPPETEKGFDLYIQAVMKKDAHKARSMIKDRWHRQDMSDADRKKFVEKYGTHLTQDDHAKRIHRLFYDRKTNEIEKILPLVKDPSISKRIRYRLSLMKGKVPSDLPTTAGMHYSYVSYLLDNKKNDEAYQILKFFRKNDTNYSHFWTKLRVILMRRFIEQGFQDPSYFKKAYDVIDINTYDTDKEKEQILFLQGLLLYRFLNKPHEAHHKFAQVHAIAAKPLGRAKSAFWASMSIMKFDPKKAYQWMEKASHYQATFYGHLAKTHLKQPVLEQQKHLPKLDPNKPIIQVLKALNNKNKPVQENIDFARAAIKECKTFEEACTVCEYLHKNFHPCVYFEAERKATVIFGKRPLLPKHLHKSKAIPKNDSVFWAFTHSIIINESSFFSEIKSFDGGLGLMQLMPATAREVSKKIALPIHSTKDILKDENNIKLGSHYLRANAEKFGSLIMAAGAYNAGPHRIQKWIKVHGDPRTGEIDWLTWIELIPFKTTRAYVLRALANTFNYLHSEDMHEHSRKIQADLLKSMPSKGFDSR